MISKVRNEPYFTAEVGLIEEKTSDSDVHEALVTSVLSLYKMAEALGKNVSPQALKAIEHAADIGELSDLISAQLSIKSDSKQDLLEILNPSARLRKSIAYLKADIDNFVCNTVVTSETAGGRHPVFGSRLNRTRDRLSRRSRKISAWMKTRTWLKFADFN